MKIKLDELRHISKIYIVQIIIITVTIKKFIHNAQLEKKRLESSTDNGNYIPLKCKITAIIIRLGYYK